MNASRRRPTYSPFFSISLVLTQTPGHSRRRFSERGWEEGAKCSGNQRLALQSKGLTSAALFLTDFTVREKVANPGYPSPNMARYFLRGVLGMRCGCT